MICAVSTPAFLQPASVTSCGFIAVSTGSFATDALSTDARPVFCAYADIEKTRSANSSAKADAVVNVVLRLIAVCLFVILLPLFSSNIYRHGIAGHNKQCAPKGEKYKGAHKIRKIVYRLVRPVPNCSSRECRQMQSG
jgi:hypothetical protein